MSAAPSLLSKLTPLQWIVYIGLDSEAHEERFIITSHEQLMGVIQAIVPDGASNDDAMRSHYTEQVRTYAAQTSVINATHAPEL